MSAYTEEQRIFINDRKLAGDTIADIQAAFQEKWSRRPAPVTVNKYGNYHVWGRGSSKDLDETPVQQTTPQDKEEKPLEAVGNEGNTLEVKVKDSRKKKEDKSAIIHFSDGKLDEKDFDKIVEMRGTDREETFSFLQKCGQKGYTKIDLGTGEISE